MSFSSDVKNELCEIRPSGCCKNAECYGVLLFGRAFSTSAVSILTEHEAVASRYLKLLRLSCSVSGEVVRQGSRREMLLVSVPNEADRIKILRQFGHSPKDLQLRIHNGVLGRECCNGAFIRGAFLACGSIADPNKDYHLEFLIPHMRLANDFIQLLSAHGLSPRLVMRGSSPVVYFKESDNIEDLLTLMNATNHTLELMNIKIYKDVRNKINRITNCETANLTKTVNAAVAQLEAIRKLTKTGELQKLPPELQEAAALREEHPELSLSELCRLYDGRITRSGLNHRLRRLIELASD